ncbi:MAG TPA: aminotransferase class V-fold PLP-dependent enzyme [Steroidobacteraceae bacterium]|nr:aminotransferase class V-fold PLP-dependent enzyme [Steroidobacteraceae bacterium]
MNANFLTGPVALRPEVRAAFIAPPVSHRESAFLETMCRTRAALNSLVNATHVALMVGSGTLANDAVAAQLRCIDGSGLILSNGEFGERLVDHARRWGLRFAVEQQPWGEPFEWNRVRQLAQRCQPAWIWAVLTETSTGVANPMAELRALSESAGADLCLDAVSAIGLMPVDLRRVRFATAVSGKGLAAFPGLAAVFHDGRLASPAQVPRYLDLAGYEAAEGVPFTHSSNLVAALERSLALTSWPQKFESVRQKSQALRAALRRHSLPPLARDEDAAPGIVTLAVPGTASAADVALALADDGIDVAYQSRYLHERNWLQIALMGEVDETALRLLPGALAGHVRRRRLISARPAAKGSARPTGPSCALQE